MELNVSGLKAERCRSAAILLLASLGLAACAGKASKPVEPLQPIARIALLPVILDAEPEQSAGKRGMLASGPQPIYATGLGGRPVGAGDALIAGAAVGLIALVDNTIRQGAVDRAQNLATAVDSLGFHPVETLNERLPARFKAEGLSIEPVAENAASRAARRDGKFQEYRDKADAVLDIRVGDHGYDKSVRAGGLAPTLEIDVSLISPTTDDELASYSYHFDWSENRTDPRWLTSSPSLIYADPQDLVAHGDAARQGLEDALQKMIDNIVEDVKHRAAGQRSVD